MRDVGAIVLVVLVLGGCVVMGGCATSNGPLGWSQSAAQENLERKNAGEKISFSSHVAQGARIVLESCVIGGAGYGLYEAVGALVDEDEPTVVNNYYQNTGNGAQAVGSGAGSTSATMLTEVAE